MMERKSLTDFKFKIRNKLIQMLLIIQEIRSLIIFLIIMKLPDF